MAEQKLLERITVNPNIFGGKPIIRGRRLAVEHVLGMLAACWRATRGWKRKTSRRAWSTHVAWSAMNGSSLSKLSRPHEALARYLRLGRREVPPPERRPRGLVDR
jgi:hypothetical protein